MSYSYDELMRQTRMTDANGLQTLRVYDLKDRVISESTVSTSPSKTITNSSVYDDDDRLVSQSDGLGNTTLYTYNALNQMSSQIDANDVMTEYEYDYRNKLLLESREGREISYSYDVMGNMIGLIDAQGNTTTMTYDQRNNLLSETYADGANANYSYDINNNLINSTDANGTLVERDYDDLYRLTSKNITQGL